jgi:hypothetical protein
MHMNFNLNLENIHFWSLWVAVETGPFIIFAKRYYYYY